MSGFSAKNRVWAFALLACLTMVIIGSIGISHMGPNAIVSRSWPPYVCAMGVLGFLASLAYKPGHRRNETQDTIDDLNDEGRYGHVFGPTVDLGTNQTYRDIKSGR